tara:strand:- start:857 stop:1315 length:459 start_codon:yes stop_codon:yes gene_type:complete
MGTRSLTTFIETYKDNEGKDKKTEIVTMYRQFDGYPNGHGLEIAEYLSKGKLVNGLSYKEPEMVFNGMGCLTAQVIADFKSGAGGIYIQRSNKDSGEDYRYHIIGDSNTKELTIKILEVGYMKGDKYVDKTRIIFKGSPKEMVEFCTEKENE